MEQKSHGSPSFINIAVLLLFAVVIAVVSTATTFYFLSSKTNEQPLVIQPSVIPPVQTTNQTNVFPTTPSTSQTTTGTDETADWNVYRNTKVGFTVKYPKRYPKPQLPSGLGPDIYANGTEDNDDIGFGLYTEDNISLIVFPFTGNVADIVEDNKSNIATTINKFRTAGRPNIKLKEDIVDGSNALWYLTDTNEIQVYFTGKKHGFLLDTNENHSRNEIEQMLSTFKFTK